MQYRKTVAACALVGAMAFTGCSSSLKSQPADAPAPATSSSTAPASKATTPAKSTSSSTSATKSASASSSERHDKKNPAAFGAVVKTSKGDLSIGQPKEAKPSEWSKSFTAKYPEIDQPIVVPVTIKNTSSEAYNAYGSVAGIVGNNITISTTSDKDNGIVPYDKKIAPGETVTFNVGIMVAKGKPYMISFSPLFLPSSEYPIYWGAK